MRAVLGFDINARRISELHNSFDRTKECSEEKIKSASGLTFSSHIDDLKTAQIYIVTVPTPVDPAHRPDLSALKKASQTIGCFLTKGDIVIYESTVYPGATEEVCVPILEKTSNLKYNRDFFCGYSPERVNPGDKINTLDTIKKITDALCST